jgi:hypothetical protein
MINEACLWFNYDNYIMSGMEVFLMTSKQPASIITKAIFIVAGLGILAIVGMFLSK